MYESFKTFCKRINNNEINFENKKIDSIIKNYTFFHVTQELSFDQNQKIFKDYESSNLVIVEYYNKLNKNGNDQFFFILFNKNVMIIKQSLILLLQSLFSFSNKPIFSFLSNSKGIFDSNIKIKYNEIQDHLNIDDDIYYLNEYFSYRGNKHNLFWNICRKCFCCYFIHQSYFKTNKNRIENF